MCGGCSSGFPVIGEIPWLFPEPRQALTEWRGRLNLLTQHLATEATAMRASLQGAICLRVPAGAWNTSRRPTKTRFSGCGCCSRHSGSNRPSIAEATHRGLGTRLPTEQGLTNYYVNLHRDWAWGDEENQAALQELRALLGAGVGSLGHTLVQGAGAGRLAYDLHGAGDAPLTVATDFNPLLLFAARELYAGRTVELYEYPIAPRSIEDYVVLRRLSAPAPARDGLMLVAADALQPPFADGAFDTVVTPWFIDIIGEPFTRVAARINLLLKPGGRWINFGSLAFARAAHAERVSLEEVTELMPQLGFTDFRAREGSMPYMRSPASRHARIESTVAWITNKLATPAEIPRARVLPEWLLLPDKPVPRTPALEMQAISSRVHAFLLALINGERSQRDMAGILVEQRLMSADEAEQAVRMFLARLHEESE